MTRLKYLAISQIAGGTLVILGALHDPGTTPTHVHFSLYIAPVLFGAVSILAGVMLLLREPVSLYLTLAVQTLQILNLGAPVRLVLLAGLRLASTLSSNGLYGTLGIGGEFGFSLTAPDGTLGAGGLSFSGSLGYQITQGAPWTWSISLNWLALYLAYYVWRYSDEIASAWAATDGPAAPPAV